MKITDILWFVFVSAFALLFIYSAYAQPDDITLFNETTAFYCIDGNISCHSECDLTGFGCDSVCEATNDAQCTCKQDDINGSMIITCAQPPSFF